METLDWMACRCKIKTVLEGGICDSNLERWFLRSKENREKQAVEKSWKTGLERALSLRIPVMFNHQREIFTEVKASKDKFPSPFKDLVPDPKSQ